MKFEKWGQWVIGVLGSVGFFLVSLGNRWGFVFIFLTEPFWFVSTFKKRQWGMFILTALYTISCLIAIYRGFFAHWPPH